MVSITIILHKTGADTTEVYCTRFSDYAGIMQEKNSLASTAAAVVVAAATAEAVAVTAAAEQNHKQNDNPAASTVTLKTHNT